MAEQKTKGKGRKVGRYKEKCKRYRDRRVRERNKLKRILQSNGREYAEWWARERQCSTILAALVA